MHVYVGGFPLPSIRRCNLGHKNVLKEASFNWGWSIIGFQFKVIVFEPRSTLVCAFASHTTRPPAPAGPRSSVLPCHASGAILCK